MSEPTTTNFSGSDIVQDFQLAEKSIQQKSDLSYGLLLAQKVESTLGSDYYKNRNSKWLKNRAIASGRLDIEEMFKDRLGLNGKTNYINLNWSCIKLGNRIVSGLVGRWMSRREKIKVTATDPLSLNDKKEEYENIEFIIENRAMMEKLQQESGVQMIPAELPEDQQGLHLWVTQIQKLPEEICFEMGCNDILAANGLETTVKEKLLHDASEVGFVGTYTWMDDGGVVHVDYVKPENAFYSDSEYDDFRDTTLRGQVRRLKISELRRKYSKEFGGTLSEEKLFEIAQTAKEYNTSDKITWIEDYQNSLFRPYDEWNVDVIDFEFKTVDSDPYTITTTKKNKSTIVKKGRPNKLADNQEIGYDTKWNIYRGCKIKGQDVMLEWGLKRNMIRPQDPKEIGNAEFSYSFFMYQNRGMENVAVPEKISEPLEGMILTRLKMQQLISTMRPPGAAIDVDAMQELDLGLGGMTTPSEAGRIYDQTGRLYYRGRDAEGRPINVPITELTNSGFLPQMQGLIAMYQFHYGVLKDELGEDPNLITQAAQPRVAVQNIDTAQQQGENATDYMYRAFLRVMEDSAVKVSCLIHKSVLYGATAYRAILKTEDVRGRMFAAKAEMLPDNIEIQRFEALMNQAMVSTPELVLHIDPFQLMRVARENVKLAEVLFRQGQKKMLQFQIQTAQQNQQQTIEGQIASARASEEEKRKTKDLESKVELLKTQTQGDSQAKNTILAGLLTMFQKQQETGSPMPMEMQLLSKTILENVAIPAMVQNDTMKQQILQDMANAMQQKQAEEQAAQQEQQNNLQVA
jgi:hypothetical protein